MRAFVPIGRILFSLIFIASLFTHFSSGAIAGASAHGVPLATLAVPAAGILAFVGGMSVLLGYRAKFGAFLLLVFLVPVTLVMHKLGDPSFMKNVSLAGCALMIMYYGSGPASLDS